MPIQDLTPQLRTRLRKVEWITGLFLGITAMLMMAGFIYFLRQTAEARGWFTKYIPYYTYMPDATGIKIGTQVQMMGFPVGEVTEVNALKMEDRASWDYYQTNDLNVYISFKVKEPYFGYIGADSRVRIGGFPIEIAGGNFIQLTPCSVTSIVTKVDLPNGRMGVLWDKFAYNGFNTNFLKYGPITNNQKGYYLALDQSETLLAQSQRILKNADEITAFLRKDLPHLADEVTKSLEFARTIVANMTNDVVLTLTTARESIASLTNDVVRTLVTAREAVASLTNDISGILNNTRRITGQVADVVPGLTNDLARTLATSQQLMSTVNEQIPSITHGLNSTLTNLNILLLRDTNITANTSLLVSNVNNLLQKHWLFRSAFKASKNSSPKLNRNLPGSPALPAELARPPLDLPSGSRPRPGDLRGGGRQ